MAQVLSGLGLNLGSCLNDSLDNLWFTSLFKRPAWVRQQWASSQSEIPVALKLFERAMSRGVSSSPSPKEKRVLESAAKDIRAGRSAGGASLEALESLLGSADPGGLRWACKEPNCHIILEEIASTFRGVRYLLVVRHGLDMAFSRNTQQVRNWSWVYGLPEAEAQGSLDPRSVFEYWAKANQRALSLGRSLLGDRFHVVNLESLCQNPGEEILKIARWADLQTTPERIATLSVLPVMPASMGRYRSNALWDLPPSDRAVLKLFGYRLELQG